jgi:hypothetical protein
MMTGAQLTAARYAIGRAIGATKLSRGDHPLSKIVCQSISITFVARANMIGGI